MFNLNDTVVYGTGGVCVISEIKEMTVCGATKAYYVLSPVDKSSPKVFVPADNAALTSKMKRVMSKREAADLLEDKALYVDWIDDRRERAQKYGEIILQGDKRRLLSLVRLLYREKLRAEAAGKKQYASDKKLMNLAEKLLNDEFSYAMELPKGSVAQYIYSKTDAAPT